MAKPHTIEMALAAEIAELARTAGYLWEKGWAERNGGNMSVDVTEEMSWVAHPRSPDLFREHQVPHVEVAGRAFLVTGAGTRMRDVAATPARHCCVLRISEDLKGYYLLWNGDRQDLRPTSELASHLAIHALLRRESRPERAFLHTHPNELIALTHMPPPPRREELAALLYAMHPELKIALPEGIGYAPYRPPGSKTLAEVTLSALREHRVAIWEKHGCVALGTGPAEAFDLIDTVNKAAVILLTCKAAGFAPEGLTAEQLDDLARLAGDE